MSGRELKTGRADLPMPNAILGLARFVCAENSTDWAGTWGGSPTGQALATGNSCICTARRVNMCGWPGALGLGASRMMEVDGLGFWDWGQGIRR
jgi:hypothetical protein